MNGPVSSIEDRLREAYRAAADTVDPDGIRPLHERRTAFVPRRWRVRSGRVLAPLAAAAAMVAIVIAVPALLSQLTPGASGPHALRTRTAPAASGSRQAAAAAPVIAANAPRLFVALSDGGAALSVYGTATGKVVADIPVPKTGDSYYGIAAAVDPRSFVVAIGHAYTCGTQLYWLRLNPAGQFAAWRPFGVPALPEDVFSVALSADGAHFAWAGEYCAGPNAGTGDIGVVGLATPDIRRWTAPGNEDIGSLSLSADGSQIGFAIQHTKLYEPAAGILPADAPAGPVSQRARLLHAQRLVVDSRKLVPEATAISADGRTLYICGLSSGARLEVLVAYSGGKLTRHAGLSGGEPCVLSLDPSGRFLLAQTSPAQTFTAAEPTMVRLELIDLASGSVTALRAQGLGALQDVQVIW